MVALKLVTVGEENACEWMRRKSTLLERSNAQRPSKSGQGKINDLEGKKCVGLVFDPVNPGPEHPGLRNA